MQTRQRFEASVTQEGTKAWIVVPFDPHAVWGLKERHHVSGTVGGHDWRGPLTHNGTKFVLALGPAWRRDHPLPAEGPVEVALAPEGPQMDNVAADVSAALEAEPEARTFFEALPSFYRRNFIRWIEDAKRPATRAARIAEMMALLKDGRRER